MQDVSFVYDSAHDLSHWVKHELSMTFPEVMESFIEKRICRGERRIDLYTMRFWRSEVS